MTIAECAAVAVCVPAGIAEAHWQEWLESGIHPDLIRLNLESLDDGDTEAGGEATFSASSRLNAKVTRFGHQSARSLRGWWVSGLDPLNNWEKMEWGRFKPDPSSPLIDASGKLRKYSSPYGQSSRLTLMQVPESIWHETAAKHGFPPEALLHYANYWDWVRHANIPVILTEGEKKAACLISNGYAAIALPGITTGCRREDQGFGKHNPYFLIPELAVFATEGRTVFIAFDYEIKPKVIKSILTETRKLAEKFSEADCIPMVLSLPGPEKGVDDFIMAQGLEAFELCRFKSINYQKWQRQRGCQLTIPPTVLLNQDKLGPSCPLAAAERAKPPKLVVLKSAKGTGKTHWLTPLCEEAIANGQRVLLITHRVQLGQELCRRLGVDYITDTKDNGFGDLLGFGICVDSLYQESQARFNPEYWRGCLIIVDEAKQVVWHTLSADTEIDNRRTKVLQNLRTLFTDALDPDSAGRIVISDADMDDTTVQFFAGLGGFSGPSALKTLNPHLILNEWKPGPEAAWNVFHYQQQQPLHWYDGLCEAIERGEKIYLVTHSQKAKSKWGTRSLENALLERFPDKRILRIDSQTIANPTHAAFGCIQNLNEILGTYDIVLASPSLETGASIDIEHFDSVWGCFQGVSAPDSVRQSLARVRQPVDRHIWVTPFSRSTAGNGSTTVYGIVRGIRTLAKWTGQLLAVGIDAESDEFLDQVAFETWAKMAAHNNLCKIGYRASVIEGLEDEGHNLSTQLFYGDTEDIKTEIDAARNRVYSKEKTAICAAELISESEAKKLDGKKERSEEEEISLRRYRLQDRYGIEINDELIELDDDGYFSQIQLYFYLTLGNEFLHGKEKRLLEKRVETKETWLPRMFSGIFSTKVRFLQDLHVLDLLAEGTTWHHDHPLIKKIAATARTNAEALRTVLRVSATAKMSDIQIVQSLLERIGCKLTCTSRTGSDGNRKRVYEYLGCNDPRESIFEAWIKREQDKLAEIAAMEAEAAAMIEPEAAFPVDTDF